MSNTIYLTSDWPLKRIAKYGNDISKAFAKYAAKFPDDTDLSVIAQDIANGNRQLWIVLDDDENFVALGTTAIEITKNKKRVYLHEAAGTGGGSLTNFIPIIEKWAREQGANEFHIHGRVGWTKSLKKRGFKTDRIQFKKELNNGIQ